MNLYEVLGVEPGADADTVKAGYRAQASANHPDKGGDGERMALVNKAYEVLSSPERRAQYDETGQTEAGPNLAEEARTTLMQIFADAIRNRPENPHAAARVLLDSGAAKLRQLRAEAQSKLARLAKAQDKVKAKGPENLYKMILDQQVRTVEDEVKVVEKGETVRLAVEELFAGYETGAVELPTSPTINRGFSWVTSA